MQKTTIEERLEKSLHDLHKLKNEHMTVNSVDFIFIHSNSLHFLLFEPIDFWNSFQIIWFDCHEHWLGMNVQPCQLQAQIQLCWLKHC